jgi:putative sterol carrier protein
VVGVKFLTEEWAQAVQDALNESPAFVSAAGTQSARVQQVVTSPDGEVRYWFELEGGKATLGIGELDEPLDATITQDYDTAAAIMKSELNVVAAYMSGRLRITTENLGKLMQLQGALSQIPAVLRDLDIEY